MNPLPLPFRPTPEGVFLGLPESEYHAAPGISHSILKRMNPTLAHGKAYLDGLEAREDEDNINLIIGSLVHHAILTPELPMPKIVMEPLTYLGAGGVKDWHNGATYRKDWHKAQAMAGLLALKKSEWDTVTGCVRSLAAHPYVQRLMAEGHSEVSIFRRHTSDPESPVTKMRIDHIPGGTCLLDFKTVAKAGDASEYRFAKIATERGYHTQGAWYFHGFNELEFSDFRPDWWELKSHFVFAVVEKEPPYAVALHFLDSEQMQSPQLRNHERLAGMVEAQRTGIWAGYPKEPTKLTLPTWAN